ncbi:hypothetical protein BT67DRAFT_458444 [Trichocladium antarcticum]|uniref:Uncharacterized protein n=1 Tax=Trichocladium antarcticum TaxID=1450529 RepID=A0AAN6UD35_9PEZI|nr:hypothetical protein BT67DRAFT_458444 [Trichocladium antarcticum]
MKIGKKHLTPASREEITRRRALWGTDVYTDDSDVISACIYAGWIRSEWPEGDKDQQQPAVAEQQRLRRHVRTVDEFGLSPVSEPSKTGSSDVAQTTADGTSTAEDSAGSKKADEAPAANGVGKESWLPLVKSDDEQQVEAEVPVDGGAAATGFGEAPAKDRNVVIESVEAPAKDGAAEKGPDDAPVERLVREVGAETETALPEHGA